MSKAKTPAKVIRTAIKRIETRFGQGSWCELDNEGVWRLCIEGALFNGHDRPQTQAQKEAHEIITQMAIERGFRDIPTFNDKEGRTPEEAVELLKLGLIRIETGGLYDPEDDYLDEEETEELLA